VYGSSDTGIDLGANGSGGSFNGVENGWPTENPYVW
jgi:hypothetical protein